MNYEEIRMECIKLSQMGTKEVGGALVPLTTDEIIKRAKAYYNFVMVKV